MLPVGMPAAGATAATLAVKLTASPGVLGLTEDARATLLDAATTLCATTAPLLESAPLLT